MRKEKGERKLEMRNYWEMGRGNEKWEGEGTKKPTVWKDHRL